MSSIYDNWEKLVGAVIRRQKDRQLAYFESISTSYSTDFSSGFSFSGEVDDLAGLKIDHSDPSSNEGFFSGKIKAIKFEELRKATGNFPASTSCVYIGWIDEHKLTAVETGSGIAVSVKKISNIEEERLIKWRDEMSLLRHPNLVRPIGYCFEQNQTILVYEFMVNGSLREHLSSMQPLSWATRIEVAVGVARALSFLHSLKTPVVYGNLETSDILLDGNFNAKLSDIGLQQDISVAEYVQRGQWSTKCDVYCYGIFLSELIIGAFGAQEIMLWSRGKHHYRNRGRKSDVRDTRLGGRYLFEQAIKAVKLALQCLESDPRSRPSMAEIVATLQQL